ncbi:alpha/beta hydrolase [Halothece sp. PCC 7418]|uniref:alpha/beta hydrolase n=1 Tax=Halothece sp. (strain PCC 7418) TaxID=65093 RepID=UPI0005A11CED|nr:alpha/beta hydrolase [Halothece sp. PCC 7418]
MESENQVSTSGKPFQRFWLLAICAIGSLSGLGIVLPVVAAETVILRHQSQRVAIPLNELKTFAESGESSESLAIFLEQIPLESSRIRELMNREISDTGRLLGPNDLQFLAIQYNKLIGDPLGRPIIEPLVEALEKTFADDRRITTLELLETYDRDEVRVDLPRLDRSVTEYERFVERIEPILAVTELLLHELVCECELQGGNFQEQEMGYPPQLVASIIPVTPASDSSPMAQRLITLPPIDGAEKVTFQYGVITVNFRVDDLTTFAETGEYPSVWNTYFGIANVSPENFRALLLKEISVDPIALHKRLNSLLGEYLLFQVSRVVHGKAGNSNIQVLRSSLMRSALSNNQLTFLEFLQNFPLSVVVIEGLNLKRFARNVGQQGVVGTVTTGVDDLLLELQSEAADEICDCPE